MKVVADQVAAAVERRRLLDALRASEEHFRAYIEQAADAIFVHDAFGRLLEVNTQACASLGYTREELLGMNVLDVAADYELPKAQGLWNGASPGEQWTITDQHRRKDGSTFPVEVRFGCFEMEGKRCFLALSRDVTERQRADEEIRRQSGLIKSLLDSIPDLIFIKDVHGVYLVCNPAFAEFVGRNREQIIGKSDHELFAQEVTDFFRHQDQQMLRALKPRQNEEWVSYPDGRKVLLDTLKTPYWGADGSLLGVLGISRDITLRNKAEVMVRDSEQRFRALVETAPEAIFVRTGEVFTYLNAAAMNLLGARSAEQLLGEKVAERFHPGCHKGLFEGMSRLDVAGEGTRVAERVLLRLDGSTVFGILKQHQGWITVDSEPGKGTRFQVYLPAIEGKTVGNIASPSPILRGGTETILLVEDDVSVRQMTRTVLERQGYSVIEAGTGVEAVRLWPQHREVVALLLTDMVMPAGMSGQQLAEELLASKPRLKVVFTSGYCAEFAGGEICLRSGERFLQKPCSPALLLETMRSALDT